jgi:hypothetical protein
MWRLVVPGMSSATRKLVQTACWKFSLGRWVVFMNTWFAIQFRVTH